MSGSSNQEAIKIVGTQHQTLWQRNISVQQVNLVQGEEDGLGQKCEVVDGLTQDPTGVR